MSNLFAMEDQVRIFLFALEMVHVLLQICAIAALDILDLNVKFLSATEFLLMILLFVAEMVLVLIETIVNVIVDIQEIRAIFLFVLDYLPMPHLFATQETELVLLETLAFAAQIILGLAVSFQYAMV